MAHRKTGYYGKNNVAGEMVEAFTPLPLPPDNPPLEMDRSIIGLLTLAEQKLSQLAVAGSMIPSLDWFIYAYVRKEAVTSSQIEGTQATLMDLLSFEADENAKQSDHPDIEEVCNYLEAIRYARGQLASEKGLPLSMRLLNETHRRLMRGVRGGNKQPGDVRQSQNWIGGARPGNAVFVPPPPHELPKLLSSFEEYLHSGDHLPSLIRIALLHVQFETIHPYLDGNGRIGRLLITLLLEHWGLLKQPLLYLSLYFKRHRDEYYRLLGNVRVEGDWESWVRFFLKGVAEISSDAVELAKHLSLIIAEDREKVLASHSATIFTIRLFELLSTHPVITMAKAVKLLDTSKPTALKAIATLESLGILAETTGRKRDRYFEYKCYLGKLKFGTELKMYRLILNYDWEDFVVKDGKAHYASKATYDGFYEFQPEAQKYYASIMKKLKNLPSLRNASIQRYDSFYDKWFDEVQLPLPAGGGRNHTAVRSPLSEDDKLEIFQKVLQKAGI